jgi:hypothetical protein
VVIIQQQRRSIGIVQDTGTDITRDKFRIPAKWSSRLTSANTVVGTLVHRLDEMRVETGFLGPVAILVLAPPRQGDQERPTAASSRIAVIAGASRTAKRD